VVFLLICLFPKMPKTFYVIGRNEEAKSGLLSHVSLSLSLSLSLYLGIDFLFTKPNNGGRLLKTWKSS
jgi:hypothetical protein